jgi:hypothetical protein
VQDADDEVAQSEQGAEMYKSKVEEELRKYR